MKTPDNTPEVILVPHELTIPDTGTTSSSFVETFVYEANKAGEDRLGNLYIVGQIYSDKKKKENAEFLTEISDLIKNEYYRDTNLDASSSFKLSLKRLNNFLLTNRNLLRDYNFKLNLSIAVIFNNSLLVTSIGDGTIFVLRSNVLNVIETDSMYVGAGSKKNSFSNITTGSIEQGDVVIMASPQIHKLSKEKIILFLNNSILANFFINRKNEFKNLGLITIRTKVNSPNERLPESLEEKITIKKTLSQELLKGNRAEAIARVLLIVSIIVSSIVITSSAIATKKEVTQKKNKAAGVISKISSLDDRISSLVELENYQEAELALRQWEEQVEILKILGVFKDEAKKQENRINIVAPKVRKYENVSIQEVINLEGNSVDFNPTEIFEEENNIILSNNNTLYTFDTLKKTGNFTILPDIKTENEKYPISIKDFTYSSDLKSFFLLSEDAVIGYENKQFGSSEERLIELTRDTRLSSAKSISYFNDKIYILSPREIWYLDPQEKELKPWLSENNFNKFKDFAIDGFIYVLEDASIQKLLNGEKNIVLRTDNDISKIFTSNSFKNLYLLNPKEGLVIIMDEFGTISRRISNEEIKGAQSFFVDSNEKTLLLLNNKRVFSISL